MILRDEHRLIVNVLIRKGVWQPFFISTKPLSLARFFKLQGKPEDFKRSQIKSGWLLTMYCLQYTVVPKKLHAAIGHTPLGISPNIHSGVRVNCSKLHSFIEIYNMN